jgi:hypothetical protein
MSEGRYNVAETPDGWRVVERQINGLDKIHARKYKTEADAWARANHLTRTWLLANAGKAVRKRANKRCECLGECDRGHYTRCGLREGEHGRIPGGADVALSVIALNHVADDMREENLRVYCQLCRLYHDADAQGGEALFTISEVVTGS